MVTITDEERKLPYAKYFDRPMAPIPQEKLDIWKGPLADPALATPIERRNDFLEGKVALEVGFTVAVCAGSGGAQPSENLGRDP